MAFTDTLLHQISTGGAPLGCAFSTCRRAGPTHRCILIVSASSSSEQVGLPAERQPVKRQAKPSTQQNDTCAPADPSASQRKRRVCGQAGG